MKSIQLAKEIAKILDSKKAQDIVAIGISNLTIVADYFVIASGTSITHIKTLAEEIEVKLKEKGIAPLRVEGANSSSWVLLDYNDVIVHIFHNETRDFYSLERLWVDGIHLDYEALMNSQE